MSASRALLAANFVDHHAVLALGRVPCSGQPCQKQPSMKTATLLLVNATSMVRRGAPGTGKHTLYL